MVFQYRMPMDGVAGRFPASQLHIFKSTRILTFPDLSFDFVIVSSANDRTRDSNLGNGFSRMLLCARDTGAD